MATKNKHKERSKRGRKAIESSRERYFMGCMQYQLMIKKREEAWQEV